mgnify:CR=1 FL=1
MAYTDKPESANEAQDHSQSLDDGGFFSLNDVIMAGRQQLTRSEHLLAADTRRNARNLLASAKLLALVVIVSLAMGVAAWAFLASLNIATDYREHHAWVYALLPVVGVATAWVYKNHGLAAKRGNNLVTSHPYAHGRPYLRLLHAHAPNGRICRSRGGRGADWRHHRQQHLEPRPPQKT